MGWLTGGGGGGRGHGFWGPGGGRTRARPGYPPPSIAYITTNIKNTNVLKSTIQVKSG